MRNYWRNQTQSFWGKWVLSSSITTWCVVEFLTKFAKTILVEFMKILEIRNLWAPGKFIVLFFCEISHWHCPQNFMGKYEKLHLTEFCQLLLWPWRSFFLHCWGNAFRNCEFNNWKSNSPTSQIYLSHTLKYVYRLFKVFFQAFFHELNFHYALYYNPSQ